MRFFKTIGRKISGFVNRILDRFEDPEEKVKQLIDEMKVDFGKRKGQYTDAQVRLKGYERDAARQRAVSARLAAEAEGACAAGNDSLARSRISLRQDSDALLATAESNARDQAALVRKFKESLDTFQAKIREAGDNQHKLATKGRIAELKQMQADAAMSVISPTDDSAWAEYERTVKKVEDKVTRAEISSELAFQESDAEDIKLLESNTGSDIDAELKAMKTRLALPAK